MAEQPPFAPGYHCQFREDDAGHAWVYDDMVKLWLAWPRNTGPIFVEDGAGQQTEKTFNDILDVLAKDKLGKGAVEQLKGAAEGSIKRQDGSQALGRAISRG